MVKQNTNNNADILVRRSSSNLELYDKTNTHTHHRTQTANINLSEFQPLDQLNPPQKDSATAKPATYIPKP